MQEVYEFLKKAGNYYLATIDGNKPRVRPFGTANIFEGKLYIQTGKRKAVSRQMAANPNIEICTMNEGRWIRIEAEVVNDDRIEAKESMLEAHPELRGMYSASDDNMQVLYLKNAVATIASFTEQPKVIRF